MGSEGTAAGAPVSTAMVLAIHSPVGVQSADSNSDAGVSQGGDGCGGACPRRGLPMLMPATRGGRAGACRLLRSRAASAVAGLLRTDAVAARAAVGAGCGRGRRAAGGGGVGAGGAEVGRSVRRGRGADGARAMALPGTTRGGGRGVSACTVAPRTKSSACATECVCSVYRSVYLAVGRGEGDGWVRRVVPSWFCCEARLVVRTFETHVPCHPLSTASQKSLSHCSRSKHAAGEPVAKRATSMICRPSVLAPPRVKSDNVKRR